MDKKRRASLEKVATHAHKTGAMMGRGNTGRSREQIEAFADEALELGVPTQAYIYSADPHKAAIWRHNFYLGWQFANGAGDAYKTPTIELEPQSEG